jgi:hypothetical protein
MAGDPPSSAPASAPTFTPGALSSDRDLWPGGTEVRFEAETPDLWLLTSVGHMNEYVLEYGDSFRRGTSTYHSTGHYVVLCKGDCNTRVATHPGPFYVSRGGGEPIEAVGVKVRAPSVMRATYVDRRAQRYLGLGVAVVGIGGGTALVIAESDGSGNSAVIGVGVLVALLGGAFGAYFGFRGDEASISVLPLDRPPAPASTTPAVSMRAPEGAMLRVRF